MEGVLVKFLFGGEGYVKCFMASTYFTTFSSHLFKVFFSYHTVNTSCKPKEMKTEPPAYIYIQRQQHSLQFL
jgi:hypothetical protein